MITTPEEYNRYLAQISDVNRQYKALLLPSNETIYEIDLNKRLVLSPENLSVSTDHQAETIYFIFDRYYDNQDLVETTPIIIFENKGNPENKQWAYAVPFIDPFTFGEDQKVLIPWVISGAVTEFSGEVEFSISFIRALKENEEYKILYRLSTQPAKSKVLKGQVIKYMENEEYNQFPNEYEVLISRINALEKGFEIYWVDDT